MSDCAPDISRLVPRLGPAYFSRVILPDSTTPEPGGTLDKLANYTGTVPWSYLAPHQTTGSLYFVDPSLKLEVVGAAISENNAEQVKAWLKSGDLVKIEEIHAAQWTDMAKEFEALVVSPFVLCRQV
ncbi:DUF2288 family protein [Luteolibacter sp.]|uniref:DUF2288 family protein n=1 Tax=Luteolibacter sp. TaxID=1962973 RepID=UPI003264DB5E